MKQNSHWSKLLLTWSSDPLSLLQQTVSASMHSCHTLSCFTLDNHTLSHHTISHHTVPLLLKTIKSSTVDELEHLTNERCYNSLTTVSLWVYTLRLMQRTSLMKISGKVITANSNYLWRQSWQWKGIFNILWCNCCAKRGTLLLQIIHWQNSKPIRKPLEGLNKTRSADR